MSDSEKPKSSWRERRKRIKHKFEYRYVQINRICKPVSECLKACVCFDILERLGHLAIVVAVIFYFAESGSRQKAEQYQAWQVINLAQGKTGSGGRKDALQDLHEDGISLVGVDVSQAYLTHLELPNADLTKANLSKANLFHATLTNTVIQDANLFKAYLDSADLRKAKLYRANLIDANLCNTKLMEAELNDANVYDAKLILADLSGADLTGANLMLANLHDANLTDVDFNRADLSGADLWRSNLRGIMNWKKIKSIEKANINDVNNPPHGFIEWAKENGAVQIRDYGEWKRSLREIRQKQTKKKQQK